MNIIIEKNKFTVDNISTRLSNVLYIVSEKKDSVTFCFNSGDVKTVSVADTSVNGVQMTATNIDQLLAPLFNEMSCNTATPTNPADICCAYTEAEYSEPLLCPEPIRSGHRHTVFRDGAVYKNFEWDGWSWNEVGFDPVLIVKYDSSKYNYNSEEAAIGVVIADSTYYYPYNPSTYGGSTSADDPSINVGPVLYLNTILKQKSKLTIQNVYFELNKNSKETESLNLIDSVPFFYAVTPSILVNYQEDVDIFNPPTKTMNLEDLHTIKLGLNARGTSFVANRVSTDIVKKEQYYEIGFNVDCNSFSLKEGKALNPKIAIYPINNDLPQVIINNSVLAEDVVITFDADTYSDGVYSYVQQADIDITGCTSYKSLSLLSKDDRTSVRNLKLDIDTTNLKSISVQNLTFSATALDALVGALTGVTVQALPFIYNGCSPALTDVQKTALTNAGWKI